ncbi:MAG: hypothetical protein R3Y12_01775 [Clostridia bacterium]
MLTLFTTDTRWQRLTAIISYACLIHVQLLYVFFSSDDNLYIDPEHILKTLIVYSLLFCSFALENYLEIRHYNSYFDISTENSNLMHYFNLQFYMEIFQKKRKTFHKTADFLTRENISLMFEEVCRNSSFFYLNKESLNEDYMGLLNDNSVLEDPCVYLVLSDTGSVPSQFISIFTEKQFNHISIAFDRDLKTLISYNGGQDLNPPGLNSEMLLNLAKKDDASVAVYSLVVTREQKMKMMEKVREINRDGSAYNLVGMFLRRSFKPNIMYCSQFVHYLLEYADASYFKYEKFNIKPTDLIELDYYKKLKFEYEIKFAGLTEKIEN